MYLKHGSYRLEYKQETIQQYHNILLSLTNEKKSQCDLKENDSFYLTDNELLHFILKRSLEKN